jgi:hypothetical protein
LATLNAQPIIRSVTGSNNQASLSSICIPLIRLKKACPDAVPTPDRARMSYPASFGVFTFSSANSQHSGMTIVARDGETGPRQQITR